MLSYKPYLWQHAQMEAKSRPSSIGTCMLAFENDCTVACT
jgi:hypothetical protein